MPSYLSETLADVEGEVQKACARFAAFNSAHEGYAVILEELEELWAEIKDDKRTGDVRYVLMRKEAVQIAAMAVRFVLDLCPDDYSDESLEAPA